MIIECFQFWLVKLTDIYLEDDSQIGREVYTEIFIDHFVFIFVEPWHLLVEVCGLIVLLSKELIVLGDDELTVKWTQPVVHELEDTLHAPELMLIWLGILIREQGTVFLNLIIFVILSTRSITAVDTV